MIYCPFCSKKHTVYEQSRASNTGDLRIGIDCCGSPITVKVAGVVMEWAVDGMPGKVKGDCRYRMVHHPEAGKDGMIYIERLYRDALGNESQSEFVRWVNAFISNGAEVLSARLRLIGAWTGWQ